MQTNSLFLYQAVFAAYIFHLFDEEEYETQFIFIKRVCSYQKELGRGVYTHKHGKVTELPFLGPRKLEQIFNYYREVFN
jgi:hypothetical protein